MLKPCHMLLKTIRQLKLSQTLLGPLSHFATAMHVAHPLLRALQSRASFKAQNEQTAGYPIAMKQRNAARLGKNLPGDSTTAALIFEVFQHGACAASSNSTTQRVLTCQRTNTPLVSKGPHESGYWHGRSCAFKFCCDSHPLTSCPIFAASL